MFDSRRFIDDNFRDADTFMGLFATYNVSGPAKDTVRKWIERGVVPSEWFALTLCLLELENGGPVSLSQYVKGAENHADPS